MLKIQTGIRRLVFLWALTCLVGCDESTPSTSSLTKNDIVFDAEFDSGNMEAVRYLSGNRFIVRPMPEYGDDSDYDPNQKKVGWNGRTWWYHFSITIAEEHLSYPVELAIDSSRAWSDRVYGADKVPVVSCDGQNWRYVSSWETSAQNAIIRDELTCPTTYVAMATPYPWAQMERYLASIDANPFILSHDTIGHTPEGKNGDVLPLYYLLLSDPDVQTEKRNVVVVSGVHPGETANSWMLTGLMAFLLSDDTLASNLRQTFNFHIYPMVNPKGVKYGHYRRTADSQYDTNRAWQANDVLEIVIVRDHILAQTQGRADYFFDLHGSWASKHFSYHSPNTPGASEWVSAVAARHPNVTTIWGQSPWTSDLSGRGWAFHHLRSHGDEQEPPVSVTLEGSYSQASWEGAPDQVADWKAMGTALVQAIGDAEGIAEEGKP